MLTVGEAAAGEGLHQHGEVVAVGLHVEVGVEVGRSCERLRRAAAHLSARAAGAQDTGRSVQLVGRPLLPTKTRHFCR